VFVDAAAATVFATAPPPLVLAEAAATAVLAAAPVPLVLAEAAATAVLAGAPLPLVFADAVPPQSLQRLLCSWCGHSFGLLYGCPVCPFV